LYSLIIVNVGLVITLSTPKPLPNPFVKVVFPAPKSPSSVINIGSIILLPNCSAISFVSFSVFVSIIFFTFTPTLNEYIHYFLIFYYIYLQIFVLFSMLLFYLFWFFVCYLFFLFFFFYSFKFYIHIYT